jgi:hypothetical protein
MDLSVAIKGYLLAYSVSESDLVHSVDAYVSQYSETNVMYFLFNLLRIKGLYMFPAHRQEVLHKRQLALCILHVSCVSWLYHDPILVQPTDMHAIVFSRSIDHATYIFRYLPSAILTSE